jgi:hypothetical protein
MSLLSLFDYQDLFQINLSILSEVLRWKLTHLETLSINESNKKIR